MRTDETSNTAALPCRQAWTPAELALMRKLAPGHPAKPELVAAFPDRTYAAIRLQLFQVRRALGVPLRKIAPEFERKQEMHTTMLDRDDPGQADTSNHRWAKGCVAASGTYLAALQRMAA